MGLIIDPNSSQNDRNLITPHFLKTIPIPPPRETAKKTFRPKDGPGTPTKFTSSLHCNTCGRKRAMKLATMILDSFGQQNPMYFNVKKLRKALFTKGVEVPENYLAFCDVCLTITPYKIQNQKLVADTSTAYLDSVGEQVFAERVKG